MGACAACLWATSRHCRPQLPPLDVSHANTIDYDCEASDEPGPMAKLFKPEVEKMDMADFLNLYDIDTSKKPLVHHDGAVPKWGKAVMQDGVVTLIATSAPKFGQAQSLHLTLVPEPIQDGRKRQLPESGLVDEPMTIKRFGTIRRYAATHQVSSILGKSGCRDLPNTVYCSEQYKQAVAAKNKDRQKYINANFAEWVMEFPRGWTSPSTTAAVQVARGETKK